MRTSYCYLYQTDIHFVGVSYSLWVFHLRDAKVVIPLNGIAWGLCPSFDVQLLSHHEQTVFKVRTKCLVPHMLYHIFGTKVYFQLLAALCTKYWYHVFGTMYFVRRTWCQVVGTIRLVPRTCYHDLFTRCLLPSWYRVLGTMYLVSSTWYHSLGTKYFVPCTCY